MAVQSWWLGVRVEWEMTANEYRVFLEGDENNLKFDYGDSCKLCVHTKTIELHTLNG